MKESSDKIQSEFEQKLRQGQVENSTHKTVANESDPVVNENARAADTANRNARTSQQPQMIPVIEEQVRIDKKTVETGSVHVHKDVHEEEVTVDLPTVQEEVSVERIAINKYVDTPPPAVRHEGEVMIIPVLKEELVVVKRLKLVEEIHVTKLRHETHEDQQVTLRREDVKISRSDLNEHHSK